MRIALWTAGLAAGMALVAVACTKNVPLGGGAGGGGAGAGNTGPACTTVDECVQPESCALCADGTTSCPTTDCVQGQCVATWPDCPAAECTVPEDCPAIGAPCQVCPDGSSACPTSDCVNGQCVGSFPSCPGYDPCAGKLCGEPCTICDPADPNCVQPAVEMYCDDLAQCTMNFPLCSVQQCSSPTDCATIDVCQLCPDGSTSCATSDCVNGQCVTTWPGCTGYDPCAGKLCGESCTLCDPADPNCDEVAVSKYCDGLGQCGMNYPVCGGPACTSPNDCAAPAVCELCPDGSTSCASADCVDGQCITIWPGCGSYDPCAGKACGEGCSVCDPADPNCGPQIEMYCDPSGNCQLNYPLCDPSPQP